MTMALKMLLFAFISIVLVSSVEGNFCNESSYGTEFVFGFVNMKHFERHTAVDTSLRLRIMSQRTSNVYITIPNKSSANKGVTLETYSHYIYGYRELYFNTTFLNDRNNDSIGGAIKITSRYPISVIAMYNMGPYLVSPQLLPTSVLTNHYVVPSNKPSSLSYSNTEILVIALNDSTQINMKGYAIGNFHRNLNKMETYIHQLRADSSSVEVLSNKPVAVFSTYNMGDVSYKTSSLYDHSMTIQVPPFDESGFHFIVPTMEITRDHKNYIIRIFARDTGAHVQIYTSSSNVKHVHIFNEIYYEITVRSSYSVEIFSDAPILVVQMVKYQYAVQYMTPIPAVSQYMTSYLAIDAASDVDRSSWHNNYVIIVPEEEATGILVNGNPLLHNVEEVTNRTPVSNYTVISLSMSSHSKVTHVGQVKFGLFVYGASNLNHHLAYGHAAGMTFNVTGCFGGPSQTGSIIG